MRSLVEYFAKQLKTWRTFDFTSCRRRYVKLLGVADDLNIPREVNDAAQCERNRWIKNATV